MPRLVSSLCVLLLPVVLVSAACSGASKTTLTTATPSSATSEATGAASAQTASPGPSAGPPPIDQMPQIQPTSATGPVLVYEAGTYLQTLVAFDLNAKRQLWSVPLNSTVNPPLSAGGRRLVVATKRSVILYTFDGSPPRQVQSGLAANDGIQNMALSADGKLLAVVTHQIGPAATAGPGTTPEPAAWQDEIVFYDLDSEREIGRIESWRPEFRAFHGTFGPVAWLPDNSGVTMWGATHSEQPGDYATIYVDGRIRVHKLEGAGYVAPNGGVAADLVPGTLPGCLSYGGHSIVVKDDSRRTLASIENDQRAFTGVGWSPDSREFLFESRPYSGVADCSWHAAEPQLYLITLPDPTARAVGDLESVYRRWYGDSIAWLDCGGRFVGERPHPFGNAASLTCLTSGSPDQSGTLYVAGQQVDTGQTFRIVGIVR